MSFRRKLAGLLFLLLAVAGSAHTAPSRMHGRVALSGYAQLLQAGEHQIQEERLESGINAHPCKPATTLAAVRFAEDAITAQSNPRAPPTVLS